MGSAHSKPHKNLANNKHMIGKPKPTGHKPLHHYGDSRPSTSHKKPQKPPPPVRKPVPKHAPKSQAEVAYYSKKPLPKHPDEIAHYMKKPLPVPPRPIMRPAAVKVRQPAVTHAAARKSHAAPVYGKGPLRNSERVGVAHAMNGVGFNPGMKQARKPVPSRGGGFSTQDAINFAHASNYHPLKGGHEKEFTSRPLPPRPIRTRF
ncbi:MAG: hypothetical protein Q9208_005493 [Pyrenodesmia sp. 3 TL-2023]